MHQSDAAHARPNDGAAALRTASVGAGTLVVVSPHLDDGVFACAEAIASHPGSVVLTVFAGFPSDKAPLTDWDARCGFASGVDAVRARRREDAAALAHLSAEPRWLDFLDGQYGRTASVDAVADALAEAIAALPHARVLAPLGLFHADHRLVHDACRRAFAARDDTLYYEDPLYRALRGVLQSRLGELAAESLEATPVPSLGTRGHAAAKAAAIACYASQVPAFAADGQHDLREPERLWRLVSSRSAGDPR